MRSPRTNPRSRLSSSAAPALALAAVLAAVLAASLACGTAPATAQPGRHRHPAHPPAHHANATSPHAADVLRLLNAARSSSQTCGDRTYPAVGPLHLDKHLGRAAQGFAHAMATQDFFDHTAPDGSTPPQRISAAGYHWRSYGEDIAAGYTAPADVVRGWLASPGHCANIMTRFADVGVGSAHDASSTYGTYWVIDLGTAS